MADYGPPVDQLLRIGDDPLREGTQDYLALGIGPEHVEDLARLAVAPWDSPDPDGPEVYGPIHAWRALGQLRAEGGIAALVSVLAGQDDQDFNDWICEEIPPILGQIGPAAIPELTALLERETAGEFARMDVVRSIAEVGKQHPEARDEVVAILSGRLEKAEQNGLTLNATIVSELIDLKAKEAAGEIERAYAGDFVDDSFCGTWHDVWHSLKLEGDPPPKTEMKHHLAKQFPFLRALSEGRLPAAGRPTADRRSRNRAKLKLEKKARKKGRKRR